MDDSTLDRFADAPDAPDADGRSDHTVAVTYRWIPDGRPCDACTATGRRLWRGDAGLVCASCKTWDVATGRDGDR